MSNQIYPLTFTPVFKDYIWGGRNLETKLGRTIPDGIIAESWDISGHPTAPTTIDNGVLKGRTLPEALDELGEQLVGSRSRPMLDRGKFPLLIKLLDANRPLSVQVHPKDDYATEHENGELGKTEMWYILHAEPDAKLIYGLKQGVTKEAFHEAIEEGVLENWLHYLPVKTGDSVFIPAGSVHAILDGIIIAEIQQNSDTTYRVYDWNRVGADGKPRPLHIEKALDVINFSQIEPGPYTPKLIEENESLHRDYITTCSYFNVEKLTFTAPTTFKGQCDGSTFEIWGTMSGKAEINSVDGALELPAIQFSLLPAALGDFKISVTEPSTLLRIYIPA